MCSVHSPPGTKPYRCEHPGCEKSFVTNQKLRTHAKTHDGLSKRLTIVKTHLSACNSEKRYTCVHGDCLTAHNSSPVYYPTWTALQSHIRTDHPPKCPHLSCNGKSFRSQKGLKAHMKLHEQSEVEVLVAADSDAESDVDAPPLKKRRGGDVGRDWRCEIEGCGKDFKSVRISAYYENKCDILSSLCRKRP